MAKIAAALEAGGADLKRAVVEGFAVESYRTGALSAAEVRLLLGHDSRAGVLRPYGNYSASEYG